MNTSQILQQLAAGKISVERALQSLSGEYVETTRDHHDPSEVAGGSEPGSFALSEAQLAVWTVQKMVPGSTAYHVPVALRLRPGAQVRIVSQALTLLSRRHPMLRARVVAPRETSGAPIQAISPPEQILVEVGDLSGLLAGHVSARFKAEVEHLLTWKRDRYGARSGLKASARGPSYCWCSTISSSTVGL